MKNVKPIHPFPARMAPEIALQVLSCLPPNSRILDPMVGSGTVLRAASESGHVGIGFDTDPLAVLISKVWTRSINPDKLRKSSKELVTKLEGKRRKVGLPEWIRNDKETEEFVSFWFAEPQKSDLSRLSHEILRINGSIGDALKIALSRLIITKNRGASLARDVSHSRPHRVRLANDFDVMSEFLKSVEFLGKHLEKSNSRGKINVSIGDARSLDKLEAACIDVVITSPPYLNAVDYLRGHKLSLVWLGYKINELRTIRSSNIGVEKACDENADLQLTGQLIRGMGRLNKLPTRQQNMVRMYVLDIFQMMKEIHRTLKPRGKAVLVIGNSCLSGVFVKNAQAVKNTSRLLGLKLVDEKERELPANRRYLPPPSKQANSELGKRMRTECVISFVK